MANQRWIHLIHIRTPITGGNSDIYITSGQPQTYDGDSYVSGVFKVTRSQGSQGDWGGFGLSFHADDAQSLALAKDIKEGSDVTILLVSATGTVGTDYTVQRTYRGQVTQSFYEDSHNLWRVVVDSRSLRATQEARSIADIFVPSDGGSSAGGDDEFPVDSSEGKILV